MIPVIWKSNTDPKRLDSQRRNCNTISLRCLTSLDTEKANGAVGEFGSSRLSALDSLPQRELRAAKLKAPCDLRHTFQRFEIARHLDDGDRHPTPVAAVHATSPPVRFTCPLLTMQKQRNPAIETPAAAQSCRARRRCVRLRSEVVFAFLLRRD